ncbi:hypothetical protein CSOJ01_05836 [Colletotrichum sojae]|uniref:Uncharacterized protein n=1 Tax=Colletotrichum sojae TaxID=2175907 RepID=A0A8H6MWX8_9PEZI|nr:hypothetical protein CSOJ01_05836 [Colletotrichum sojae]
MSYTSHINGDRLSSTDDGTQPGSSDDQPTASQSSVPYQAGGTNAQQHNGYPAQVDGYPAQVNGHPAQVNGAADSSREMTQPAPAASEPLAADNTGLGEVGGATDAIDLSVRPWSPEYTDWLRRDIGVGHTHSENLTRLSQWSLHFRIVLYHVYPRHTWPFAKALMWQNLKNNIDATGLKVQRLISLTHNTQHKEELESVRREIDSL